MAQLPAPLRAAFGLAATLTDVVRDGRALPENLPDRVLELPVLLVSTALQVSLRAQQQYAALTVRGDEVLAQLRGGAPDDAPDWAQFDETPDTPAAQPAPDRSSPPTPAPAKAAVKQAAVKKAVVKKAVVKKAVVKKAVVKKAVVKEAVVKEAVVKEAVVKEAANMSATTQNPAKKAASKTPANTKAATKVAAPRNRAASAFDRADDFDGPDRDGLGGPS